MFRVSKQTFLGFSTVILSVSFLTACDNGYSAGGRAGTGALIGGGTGAAIGALAGGGRGAAIGIITIHPVVNQIRRQNAVPFLSNVFWFLSLTLC